MSSTISTLYNIDTQDRDLNLNMDMDIQLDSRFTSHSLFPLFTQLVQCRYTTCFSFRSAEIQSILNDISTLFHSFFSPSSPSSSSSFPSLYDDKDPTTMTLVNGCFLIVLQILEVYEHTIELETKLSNLCSFTPLSTSSSSSTSNSSPSKTHLTTTQWCSSSEEISSNKLKRNNHPPEVTNLLKAWVLKHETHPYPDEEQKQVLCQLTQLTREQLDHWFINARRRFLKSNTPISSYVPFPSCPSSSSSSSSTTSFSNANVASSFTPSTNSLHLS